MPHGKEQKVNILHGLRTLLTLMFRLLAVRCLAASFAPKLAALWTAGFFVLTGSPIAPFFFNEKWADTRLCLIFWLVWLLEYGQASLQVLIHKFEPQIREFWIFWVFWILCTYGPLFKKGHSSSTHAPLPTDSWDLGKHMQILEVATTTDNSKGMGGGSLSVCPGLQILSWTIP